MLNLFQHLTKSRSYETPKQVRGDKNVLFQRSRKSMLRNFTLKYWDNEGWYAGRLEEIPGVFSQGESLHELEENIREAYQLMKE
ncbi:MAG TPA: type II toxin-antitoxin system HicB family antitoxin [Candidatus Brocadiia bacterium]|nr:type II toxin-antitoxin system HicB family antitoxin [Candidatus Brocadiales bacterium]